MKKVIKKTKKGVQVKSKAPVKLIKAPAKSQRQKGFEAGQEDIIYELLGMDNGGQIVQELFYGLDAKTVETIALSLAGNDFIDELVIALEDHPELIKKVRAINEEQ